MVLKYKEKWNRFRNSKNRGIRVFLFIFFMGQLLFLTSKDWFPNGAGYQKATPIYTVKEKEGIKFTITRWEYAEEQKEMEVEINIVNNSLSDKVSYRYEAMTKDLKKMNIEILAENEDFIVAKISKVPTKWKEMIFNIYIMKDSDQNGEQVKFYTNEDSIKRKKGFSELTSGEYYENHINLLLEKEKNEIEKYRKENEEKTQKQKEYAARILDLQKNKKFQTEEEQSETESLINQVSEKIIGLEEEKKLNEKLIEKSKEKIKKFQEKLKAQKKREEKK